MILSDNDILEYNSAQVPLIVPFIEKNLGPSSVDLTLSSQISIYEKKMIEIGEECPNLIEKEIASQGYILYPQDFILASTNERVNIPHELQGWIETRGNVARAGLQVHNNDGHIDPGFRGKITLEIVNNNNIPIKIFPHFPICQIFFIRMLNQPQNPYNGKYQDQIGPTAYLP